MTLARPFAERIIPKSVVICCVTSTRNKAEGSSTYWSFQTKNARHVQSTIVSLFLVLSFSTMTNSALYAQVRPDSRCSVTSCISQVTKQQYRESRKILHRLCRTISLTLPE